MHSTDNLQDGYIGSGKLLWRSIKKYGAEQHVCEVLEHLLSREALRLRETQLVNDKLLQDPMCMNLAVGGEGGWEHVNALLTQEHYQCAGLLGAHATAKSYWSTIAARKKRSEDLKADYASGARRASGCSLRHAEMTERAKQPQAISRRKATYAERKHQQGIANSSFGTRWVHKDGVVKKVKLERLDASIADGWLLGRKQ